MQPEMCIDCEQQFSDNVVAPSISSLVYEVLGLITPLAIIMLTTNDMRVFQNNDRRSTWRRAREMNRVGTDLGLHRTIHDDSMLRPE